MRNRTNAVCRARPAFTLVELMVVIALIAVITAIGIVAIPLFNQQQRATSSSSQIVAWLGNAKAQALRQQRATGIRLVQDSINPSFVRELQLVQTPDDIVSGMGDTTPGFIPGRLYQTGTGLASQGGVPTTSQTLIFTNVDFFGGLSDASDYPVQPGDYLEIAGGQLYQIGAIQNVAQNIYSVILSRPALVPAATSDPSVTNPTFGLTLTGNYTNQWRIIRQPRRVPGEDSLTLTGNVVIDLSISQNVPVRTVTIPANPPTQPVQVTYTYVEIVFAPNGGVVGRGTFSSDRIILWVHDSTQSDPTANVPALISVQVRTGFIGSYAVDTSSGDFYSFARDPRAGGM